MPTLKNPKHERFAQLLAQGKNASEAYIAVGYKGDRTAASRLSTKVNVKDRVQELVTVSAEKAGVTVERVMAELAKIGFSDIRKAFTESGGLKRPEEWDDEFAGAVASVKVITRQSGERDEEDRPILEHVHEFKAWDKRAALVDLGKQLGMFKDDGDKAGDIHIHFDAEMKGVL